MSWKCYERISYFTEYEDISFLYDKALVITNFTFGVSAVLKISIVVFSFVALCCLVNVSEGHRTPPHSELNRIEINVQSHEHSDHKDFNPHQATNLRHFSLVDYKYTCK